MKTARDFDNGRILTLVLAMSIPTCLSQAVNVLYSIVDRMFIGNIAGYGADALAGVGVAAPVTSLISSFAVLVGLGGSPLMAIREGHREHEEAERILGRRAMISVMSGAVINIALDPLFIFTFGMGVKGAAIATVISQAASFAITITSLISSKARIRLRLTAPRGYIVKKTVKLGLSPFIIIATDSLIMIILNTILQMYGGEGLGDKLLTCSTIIQSYHLLVMNPLGGITGGSQGLLSYSYGAGRTDRVRSTYLHVQVLATIYTVLMMIFSWTNARFFIQLFTSDEEIIQLSIHYLKIFTAMIIPLSFQYNTVDTFTALGKSEISLPLSLFRKLVFTVSIFIIPYITKEAGSAFFAEPASDIISSLVSTTTLLIMLPRVLRERTSLGLSI